jgi:hypothetical protein
MFLRVAFGHKQAHVLDLPAAPANKYDRKKSNFAPRSRACMQHFKGEMPIAQYINDLFRNMRSVWIPNRCEKCWNKLLLCIRTHGFASLPISQYWGHGHGETYPRRDQIPACPSQADCLSCRPLLTWCMTRLKGRELQKMRETREIVALYSEGSSASLPGIHPMLKAQEREAVSVLGASSSL